MSRFLDAAARQDPQRAADLDVNDALERELQQADLDYLAGQKAREQRRLQETADMERRFSDRLGWLV